MILLSGHSLAEAGIVGEEALSVSLKERESTAQLTPERMDGITVNSWLKSTAGAGAGTVWKVRSIEQIYNTRTPVVQLEHVIGTLKDNILFGEITPAVITGNAGATTCTALQAVNYILALSSDWTLGTMASAYQSVTNAYKFDGDNLFDALERVTETLEDAWWSYDLTVYPFLLNITAKPDGVACELRAGRNLRALSRTVDKTGMYTRFYPIGKDDLHISGNYVSKNVSTYGVIDHVETDTTLTTEAELTAWANRRLEKHAQPRVSITADGLELADATGVPLDRLHLGRICRMPLPEFGTTIEERIVELNYQDAAHRPEEVRITMANSQDDVTKILAEAIKGGSSSTGSAAREGARQSKNDHAWIEDTDTRVALVVGTNSGGNYIKAGEIALAINNAGESEAHIDANKVYIGNQKSTTVINGKLDVDDLTATLIQTILLDANEINVNALKSNSNIETSQLFATYVTVDSGGWVSTPQLNLNNNAITNCIVSASVDSTTGVVTLTYADGTPVTFSRAAPTERVVGTWSGSTYTVASSASGQSLPISATVYQAVEGTANPGTTIYAKTYKNSPTQGNEILTTAMTLAEDVANKEVTLTANSLTKGKISTQATWDAGEAAGEITGAAAAKAAVTLSSAWTGSAANGWTFTVSNSANSRTSATTITRTVGTWSNHKLPITIQATNKPESRLWQWDVDATGVYNSVTVSTISAPVGTSQTVTLTATASNGNTKTRDIAVTNSGFADGGVYAQARFDSTSGSVIARQWISLPASATWTHSWTTSTLLTVNCTVGGKTYSTTFQT